MANKASVVRPQVQKDLTPEELAKVIASEAQLREAQALGQVGSWQWDIVADKITWSDELYRHFGLDPEDFEASYEAFIERIHPDDRELVNSTVDAAFADHQPWAFEHRIVRPDGEARWVFGQGAVEVKDGKPIRMFGTEQDITEQRQAEEIHRHAYEQNLKLEQAEKNAEFRTSLLNVVAHELNTPLTPLRLQASVLLNHKDDLPENMQKATQLIDRNVRRLALLVSDVLDMSRSESGNMALRIEQIPVDAIIQDVVDTFEPSADEKGLALKRPEGTGLQVHADGHRITQVLLNLVKNAIKFTPEGGTITIEADEGPDSFTLAVSDTGRGLTAEKIHELFQPFSQVHDDQGSGGHGLGLFISKGIMEAHGGSLDVTSEGEGKGSTFTLQIPKGLEARS